MREEDFRKVWEGVFSPYTVDNIMWLMRRYYIDGIEGIISTGKEANVYSAIAPGGGQVAVKVYRIETSSFKDMAAYIEGDPRFEKVKRDKRALVETWARKEYKNLLEAKGAGVRVPEPIASRKNVLVMEFIGRGGKPAPTLHDAGPIDPEKEVRTMLEWAGKLYEAGLVHADLNEFNVLVGDEDLVLIDMGQAVSVKHPRAKEFLLRDIENIGKYGERNGVRINPEKEYERITGEKEEGDLL